MLLENKKLFFETMKERYHQSPVLIAGAIFAIIILIVFGRSLNYEMLEFDSAVYILKDEAIREISWKNIHQIFTTNYFINYNPLHRISYMLEYPLWESFPAGYRITNWILHWLSTTFCFAFFLQFTRKHLTAWFLAIFFAIHPTRVECVVWLAQRKDVLSAAFGFAALWCFGHYLQQTDLKQRILWYLIVLGLYFGAVASKSQWVPFVMVLIAVEWIVKRSLSRWQLLSYIPFIVLSVMFSWWTYQAQILSEENKTYIFSFSNWVNSPIRDIAIYFKLIAWPIGLFFRATSSPPVELWQVLVGWGLIVAWGLAAWKLPAYRQAFLWGGGWFLLFLSPMLNLVPGVLVPSDRYLYIAILGPLFPVAFWLEQKPLVVSTSILLAISLVFGILTFNYLPAWQDDYSLWDNAVAHNPMNKKTLVNFAVTARGLGKIQEQYIVLSYLLTLEPKDFKCHVDLGIAAHKLQQYEIAAKHLSYVYKDYPKFQEDDEGCFRLGHALVMIGQPKQACSPLTRAIQLKPFFPQYWYTLGEAYKASGDSVNALQCYRKVRDLNPIYTEKVQPKIIALEEELKRTSLKPSSSNP